MLHDRPDYNERIQDNAGLIPADEPVFLLRAQDGAAFETIQYWCRLALRLGAKPEMIQAVRAHASRMHEWIRTNNLSNKIPDMPPRALDKDKRIEELERENLELRRRLARNPFVDHTPNYINEKIQGAATEEEVRQFLEDEAKG